MMTQQAPTLFARRSPEHARHIANWLNNLARLVRKANDDGSASQIAEYTEMLMRDLPVTAFSVNARHQVAAGIEWWPPYCVLRAKLCDHWQAEQRSRASDLSAHDIADTDSGLAGMDSRWRDFYARQEHAGWIEPGEKTLDPPHAAARRARALSLIRRESPMAYLDIIQTLRGDDTIAPAPG